MHFDYTRLSSLIDKEQNVMKLILINLTENYSTITTIYSEYLHALGTLHFKGQQYDTYFWHKFFEQQKSRIHSGDV